jgi:tetratricopeptide (TPR) repeat protein
LSLKPDHLPTLNALGGVYLSLGDLEGAERSFEKILAMDSNDADALLGLMAVSMKSGNLERATLFRDRLVKDQPDNLELRRLSDLLEHMKHGE